MATLYQITFEQKLLVAEIEAMEGELTPEMEQALVINKEELENKSLAYLEVIRQKEAFDIVLETEIKRLQAIKKRNDNISTRLKENLLNAVITFGDFEVGTHKFSTRKSSGLIVEDVNSLPSEYKIITVTEKADTLKIKELLKEGGVLKGCYIDNRLNLKIS